MDTVFIVANIFSLVGNISFTLSSIFKKKRTILSFQTVNFALGTTSEILQKAWSGFAQDSMNLVKAIILLFVNESRKRLIVAVNVVCMTISFAGGIVLNIILADNVWYGYPPVFTTLLLSTCTLLAFVLEMSEEKSAVMIKTALIINGIAWSNYGFFVKLYPIMIFNCITIVLSVASIIRMKKGKKFGAK